MKRLYILLIILFCHIGVSQAGTFGGPAMVEKYICMDGRSLKREFGNYVWYARRGCFKSMVPCYTYQAEQYAYTSNPGNLAIALFRCRDNYPYRLGEMQTH